MTTYEELYTYLVQADPQNVDFQSKFEEATTLAENNGWVMIEKTRIPTLEEYNNIEE